MHCKYQRDRELVKNLLSDWTHCARGTAEWRKGYQSQEPAFRHSAQGLGGNRLHEIPGLLEGVLGVTDGNPL